jgi:hypothetical protein
VEVSGVTLLATLWYIVGGRKSYTPPKETTEDYIERTHAATMSEIEEGGGLSEETVEPEKKDIIGLPRK